MNSDIASIAFLLEWRSQQALHRDRYFLPGVNFWRDLLPQPLDSAVNQLIENGQLEMVLPAGELVEPFSDWEETNRTIQICEGVGRQSAG